MNGRRSALAAPLLLALAACSGTESPGTFCPTAGDQGPALAAGEPYLLVAHSLSENWVAAPLTGSDPAPLPGAGLTGRSPNDIDGVGDRIYVTNSGDNTVSVIDPATGRTTGCIDLGAGSNPWLFAVDPVDSTRAWMTTFLSGEIVELDLTRSRVRRRQGVAPGLEGLLVDSTTVWVTLTGFEGTEGSFGDGFVIGLDRSTLAERFRHPVPTNPQFLVRGADDRIHVISSGNFDPSPSGIPGAVVRIEADGSAVLDTLTLGGSPARAVLAPDGRIFLAAFFGGVMAYDSATLSPLHDAGNPISAETGFSDVTIAGGRLYAANFDLDAILVVDLQSDQIVDDFLVRDGPIALASAPR